MNIFEVLIASQFLPKFAGTAAFDISKKGIKFSRIGQIWQLIPLPIIIALLYQDRENIPLNWEHINTWLATNTVFNNIILAIFGFIQDAFYQHEIIDIVESIDDYDKKTGYNEISSSIRESAKIRVWSFVYSIVLVAFSACRLITGWNVVKLHIVIEILMVHIDYSILMYAVFVTLFGMRLRHFNLIVDNDRKIKVQNANSSNSMSDIENIRSLYTNVVLIGEKLENYYGIRVLLCTSRAMLSVIWTFYSLLTTNNVTVAHTIAVLTQLFVIIVGLFVFTLTSEFTNDQANDTLMVLLEKNIRSPTQTDRYRNKLFILTLQLSIEPFSITARGFYSVNSTVTYEIFTASATYMALCLQTGYGYTF